MASNQDQEEKEKDGALEVVMMTPLYFKTFQDYRNRELFTDLYIQCDGKRFPVHSAIIAAACPPMCKLLKNSSRILNEHKARRGQTDDTSNQQFLGSKQQQQRTLTVVDVIIIDADRRGSGEDLGQLRSCVDPLVLTLASNSKQKGGTDLELGQTISGACGEHSMRSKKKSSRIVMGVAASETGLMILSVEGVKQAIMDLCIKLIYAESFCIQKSYIPKFVSASRSLEILGTEGICQELEMSLKGISRTFNFHLPQVIIQNERTGSYVAKHKVNTPGCSSATAEVAEVETNIPNRQDVQNGAVPLMPHHDGSVQEPVRSSNCTVDNFILNKESHNSTVQFVVVPPSNGPSRFKSIVPLNVSAKVKSCLRSSQIAPRSTGAIVNKYSEVLLKDSKPNDQESTTSNRTITDNKDCESSVTLNKSNSEQRKYVSSNQSPIVSKNVMLTKNPLESCYFQCESNNAAADDIMATYPCTMQKVDVNTSVNPSEDRHCKNEYLEVGVLISRVNQESKTRSQQCPQVLEENNPLSELRSFRFDSNRMNNESKKKPANNIIDIGQSINPLLHKLKNRKESGMETKQIEITEDMKQVSQDIYESECLRSADGDRHLHEESINVGLVLNITEIPVVNNESAKSSECPKELKEKCNTTDQFLTKLGLKKSRYSKSDKKVLKNQKNSSLGMSKMKSLLGIVQDHSYSKQNVCIVRKVSGRMNESDHSPTSTNSISLHVQEGQKKQNQEINEGGRTHDMRKSAIRVDEHQNIYEGAILHDCGQKDIQDSHSIVPGSETYEKRSSEEGKEIESICKEAEQYENKMSEEGNEIESVCKEILLPTEDSVDMDKVTQGNQDSLSVSSGELLFEIQKFENNFSDIGEGGRGTQFTFEGFGTNQSRDFNISKENNEMQSDCKMELSSVIIENYVNLVEEPEEREKSHSDCKMVPSNFAEFGIFQSNDPRNNEEDKESYSPSKDEPAVPKETIIEDHNTQELAPVSVQGSGDTGGAIETFATSPCKMFKINHVNATDGGSRCDSRNTPTIYEMSEEMETGESSRSICVEKDKGKNVSLKTPDDQDKGIDFVCSDTDSADEMEAIEVYAYISEETLRLLPPINEGLCSPEIKLSKSYLEGKKSFDTSLGVSSMAINSCTDTSLGVSSMSINSCTVHQETRKDKEIATYRRKILKSASSFHSKDTAKFSRNSKKTFKKKRVNRTGEKKNPRKKKCEISSGADKIRNAVETIYEALQVDRLNVASDTCQVPVQELCQTLDVEPSVHLGQDRLMNLRHESSATGEKESSANSERELSIPSGNGSLAVSEQGSSVSSGQHPHDMIGHKCCAISGIEHFAKSGLNSCVTPEQEPKQTANQEPTQGSCVISDQEPFAFPEERFTAMLGQEPGAGTRQKSSTDSTYVSADISEQTDLPISFRSEQFINIKTEEDNCDELIVNASWRSLAKEIEYVVVRDVADTTQEICTRDGEIILSECTTKSMTVIRNSSVVNNISSYEEGNDLYPVTKTEEFISSPDRFNRLERLEGEFRCSDFTVMDNSAATTSNVSANGNGSFSESNQIQLFDSTATLRNRSLNNDETNPVKNNACTGSWSFITNFDNRGIENGNESNNVSAEFTVQVDNVSVKIQEYSPKARETQTTSEVLPRLEGSQYLTESYNERNAKTIQQSDLKKKSDHMGVETCKWTSNQGAQDRFKCISCLKMLKTEKLLLSHVLKNHKSHLVSQCPVPSCAVKIAKNKLATHLKNHQFRHRHKCSFCSFSTNLSGALSRHESVHTKATKGPSKTNQEVEFLDPVNLEMVKTRVPRAIKKTEDVSHKTTGKRVTEKRGKPTNEIHGKLSHQRLMKVTADGPGSITVGVSRNTISNVSRVPLQKAATKHAVKEKTFKGKEGVTALKTTAAGSSVEIISEQTPVVTTNVLQSGIAKETLEVAVESKLGAGEPALEMDAVPILEGTSETALEGPSESAPGGAVDPVLEGTTKTVFKGELPIHCCSTVLSTVRELANHVRQKHLSMHPGQAVSCIDPDCPVFLKASNMTSHLQNHIKPPGKLTCHLCTYSTNYQLAIRTHTWTHKRFKVKKEKKRGLSSRRRILRNRLQLRSNVVAEASSNRMSMHRTKMCTLLQTHSLECKNSKLDSKSAKCLRLHKKKKKLTLQYLKLEKEARKLTEQVHKLDQDIKMVIQDPGHERVKDSREILTPSSSYYIKSPLKDESPSSLVLGPPLQSAKEGCDLFGDTADKVYKVENLQLKSLVNKSGKKKLRGRPKKGLSKEKAKSSGSLESTDNAQAEKIVSTKKRGRPKGTKNKTKCKVETINKVVKVVLSGKAKVQEKLARKNRARVDCEISNDNHVKTSVAQDPEVKRLANSLQNRDDHTQVNDINDHTQINDIINHTLINDRPADGVCDKSPGYRMNGRNFTGIESECAGVYNDDARLPMVFPRRESQQEAPTQDADLEWKRVLEDAGANGSNDIPTPLHRNRSTVAVIPQKAQSGVAVLYNADALFVKKSAGQENTVKLNQDGTMSSDGYYHCPLCSEFCLDPSTLVDHYTLFHSKHPPYECKFEGCPALLSKQNSLKHLASHLYKRNFDCPFCSYSHKSLYLLKHHLMIHNQISQILEVNKRASVEVHGASGTGIINLFSQAERTMKRKQRKLKVQEIPDVVSKKKRKEESDHQRSTGEEGPYLDYKKSGAKHGISVVPQGVGE